MKVKVNNATADFGQSKRRAFPAHSYTSGTGKGDLANEIARELPRDGKSVSKESYYVIILVCAK